LADDGVGDGCYGFCFEAAFDTFSDCAVVEARIANVGTLIGAPVLLGDAYQKERHPFGLSGVQWLGGLRFQAWIDRVGKSNPKVTAVINGSVVAEVCSRTWRHVGSEINSVRALPAFDIHLPARFADGNVRNVRILNDAGHDIPGSPVTFVAFDDHTENERSRAQLFDPIVPNSMPLSEYNSWTERFPPPKRDRVDISAPVAVVFVGDENDERSLNSLYHQTCANWVAITLPSCRNRGDFNLDQLRKFFQDDASDCDVVIFAISGIRLENHAIESLVAAFADHPRALAVYSDLGITSKSTRVWPIALPAFDYERMLEQGYCSHLFAVRLPNVRRAITFGASNLYRLFNMLLDEPVPSGAILHLPVVLGILPQNPNMSAAMLASATAEHLQQRGVEAEVTPQGGALFPAVRVSRSVKETLTSIIIPVRNHVDRLRRCLEMIQPVVARASSEVVIVDNDSSDPDMLALLSLIDGRSAKVVRVPGGFNSAKLNNVAARVAEGHYLCLLNSGIEALDARWLDEMLSRIAEPDVGAVGGTLVWPSGVIQHAGIVLGSNLGVADAFSDRMQDDPGYADMLTIAHECSAVTAACLLTRRSYYNDVGGLDEVHFPVHLYHVDFCLKLRSRGKRIVVTPHARLLNQNLATQSADTTTDLAPPLQRELRTLRTRWLDSLVNDPYYSPWLSLDSLPFSALACPPRAMSSRINGPQQPEQIPSGM
jgi:GT2 family glycosyltransferase